MTLSVAERRRYTIEEYLRMEAQSAEKHEYWDGFIVPLSQLIAMAGGTYEHGAIGTNVILALGSRLEGGPCRVMGPDLRVRIPRTPFYFYPDASVICGQAEFDPQAGGRTTVLNPRLVVEVLSPSTEADDRGKKLRRYLQVPSLEEYVLVSQTEPHVDSYFRHADGSWTFDVADGLEATLSVRSLRASIPLAEIYAKIEFPSVEPEGADPAPPRE